MGAEATLRVVRGAEDPVAEDGDVSLNASFIVAPARRRAENEEH
jgi:hypothetical protein